MELDSQRLDDPAVEFAFLAPQVLLYIHFAIGSEYFVDLVAQYLFLPALCNLSFGGPCPATGVVVSFLPCSARIERLGSLSAEHSSTLGIWHSP